MLRDSLEKRPRLQHCYNNNNTRYNNDNSNINHGLLEKGPIHLLLQDSNNNNRINVSGYNSNSSNITWAHSCNL